MERERETMSLYEKLKKKEKESEGTMYVLFHFLVGQREKGFCLTDSFDLNPKAAKGVAAKATQTRIEAIRIQAGSQATTYRSFVLKPTVLQRKTSTWAGQQPPGLCWPQQKRVPE